MNPTMHACHDCDHPIGVDDQYCAQCGARVTPASIATASGGQRGADDPEMGDPGTGLHSLESTLRSDGSDAGRLVLASFERLRSGDADDALLAAESAVAMNPRLWSAHLIAGVARNQRGETEHAEAHLHDALKLEPMAVHHKTTLERMLAASTPRRVLTRPAWTRTLSPTTWAVIAGVPLLLIGLLWVGITGTRRRSATGIRPNYQAMNPADAPQGPSFGPSLTPANQPYPTPAPPARTYPSLAPAYPQQPYVPPAANAPSAPPPLTYQDQPYPLRGVANRPERRQVASLSGSDSSVEPLPPARPDLSGAPELLAQRRDSTGSGLKGAPESRGRASGPAFQPSPARSLIGGIVGAQGASIGSARIGFEPSQTMKSTLPPPPDAVTSSSEVRAAPRPAKPVETLDASGPSGRTLQAQARNLQDQEKWDDAARAYKDAIAAYQEEISKGRNPRSAEYGLAASRAALDLIESR